MAAFCTCCGAEIGPKAEACAACGAPQHGMLRASSRKDSQIVANQEHDLPDANVAGKGRRRGSCCSN